MVQEEKGGLEEWLDEGTRVQAYDIAGRMVTEYQETIEEAIRMRSAELVDYFRDILK